MTSLENSLRQLDTDYIDIFQLHGVSPERYDEAIEIIAPVLLKEREKGKLKFLGVTEAGSSDPEHAMVVRAVEDGVWDVVMVAFHMMHQNARTQVFPGTVANRIGTLLMFAVRNIFSKPARLTAELRQLTAKGKLPRWLADAPNPLGFFCTKVERARSLKPLIALCVTSRASTSCCSALATLTICARISPRFWRPLYRLPTARP